MEQDQQRAAIEAAIRRLEKWLMFQESHERDMTAMGRFPRETGPHIPTSSSIRELIAELRHSLR